MVISCPRTSHPVEIPRLGGQETPLQSLEWDDYASSPEFQTQFKIPIVSTIVSEIESLESRFAGTEVDQDIEVFETESDTESETVTAEMSTASDLKVQLGDVLLDAEELLLAIVPEDINIAQSTREDVKELQTELRGKVEDMAKLVMELKDMASLEEDSVATHWESRLEVMRGKMRDLNKAVFDRYEALERQNSSGSVSPDQKESARHMESFSMYLGRVEEVKHSDMAPPKDRADAEISRSMAQLPQLEKNVEKMEEQCTLYVALAKITGHTDMSLITAQNRDTIWWFKREKDGIMQEDMDRGLYSAIRSSSEKMEYPNFSGMDSEDFTKFERHSIHSSIQMAAVLENLSQIKSPQEAIQELSRTELGKKGCVEVVQPPAGTPMFVFSRCKGKRH